MHIPIIFVSTVTMLFVAGGTFFILKLSQKKKEKPSPKKVDVAMTALNLLFKDLPMTSKETLPILTYEEVIKYLVQRTSETEIKNNSKKGIVLRQSHSQGYKVGQAFLDENNQIILDSQAKPYGRQLIAKELDDELKETFGDKNYFIVI